MGRFSSQAPRVPSSIMQLCRTHWFGSHRIHMRRPILLTILSLLLASSFLNGSRAMAMEGESFLLRCSFRATTGAFRFSASGQLKRTPFTPDEGYVNGQVQVVLSPPGDEAPTIDLGKISVEGQWKRIPAGQLGKDAVDRYILRPTQPELTEYAIGQWLFGYPDGTLTSTFVRLKNGQEYRAGCFVVD